MLKQDLSKWKREAERLQICCRRLPPITAGEYAAEFFEEGKDGN
jgi:hypothetical protein